LWWWWQWQGSKETFNKDFLCCGGGGSGGGGGGGGGRSGRSVGGCFASSTYIYSARQMQNVGPDGNENTLYMDN
jgi:hypothetical protein